MINFAVEDGKKVSKSPSPSFTYTVLGGDSGAGPDFDFQTRDYPAKRKYFVGVHHSEGPHCCRRRGTAYIL